MRVPHYPRCERTQQENRTHSLGSFLPIAALCINVRIGLLCLKQKINRHPPAQRPTKGSRTGGV